MTDVRIGKSKERDQGANKGVISHPIMNIHITRPRRSIGRNDKNHIGSCFSAVIQVLGVLHAARIVVCTISAAMQSTESVTRTMTWGSVPVLYHGNYMDFLCVGLAIGSPSC